MTTSLKSVSHLRPWVLILGSSGAIIAHSESLMSEG